MATDGDLPEKARKLMWVEHSANASLTPSHKVEGGFSPLVHGDNGVDEQAVLFEYEGNDSEGALQLLIGLGIIVTTATVTVVLDRVLIPKAKKWWAARRGEKPPAMANSTDGEIDSRAAAGVDMPDAVGTDLEEVALEVTSKQWYQLLFDAVMHGAAGSAHHRISADSWAALMTAHVVDDDETQALATAMRELSPQEVSEGIERVLAAHPELRDEDPEVTFARLLESKPRSIADQVHITEPDDPNPSATAR